MNFDWTTAIVAAILVFVALVVERARRREPATKRALVAAFNHYTAAESDFQSAIDEFQKADTYAAVETLSAKVNELGQKLSAARRSYDDAYHAHFHQSAP